MGSPRRGWKGCRVEFGERTLGLVEVSNQEEAPDLEIPCVRGVHPVAVLFKCCPCRIEPLRRPTQVARDERDFALGDHAPRAGHSLLGAEGASGTSQESFRSNEIAELRHRDASKR
jgi:hypothetical protein